MLETKNGFVNVSTGKILFGIAAALLVGFDGVSLGHGFGGHLRLSFALLPLTLYYTVVALSQRSRGSLTYPKLTLTFLWLFCLVFLSSYFWAPSSSFAVYQEIRVLIGPFLFVAGLLLDWDFAFLFAFNLAIATIESIGIILRYAKLAS